MIGDLWYLHAERSCFESRAGEIVFQVSVIDGLASSGGDPRCHGGSISPLRIGPPITSPRSGRVRCNKLFAVPEAQDEEL
jgi:hypothetical protein